MPPRDLLPRLHPDLAAALRELLGHPISRPRWRAMAPDLLAELEGRATTNGTTVEEELLRAAAAGVYLARAEGDAVAPRHFGAWIRWYLGRVERLVCEDLVPGWSRRHPEVSLADLLAADDPRGEAEDRIGAVQEVTRLEELASPAERDVLRVLGNLLADGYSPREARLEAARLTGRNPNSLRQLLDRLRRKASRA